MVAISGRVATAPWHKISKNKGVGYCEFSVLDSKNKAHHCIAFDRSPSFLAKKLSDELRLDCRVAVQGEALDDKIKVTSFTLLDKLEEVRSSKIVTRASAPTGIDKLMDILTPKYVTDRMRAFFKTGDIRKIAGGFDLNGYKKLIAELEVEAENKSAQVQQ
jgi:hypothetical protein